MVRFSRWLLATLVFAIPLAGCAPWAQPTTQGPKGELLFLGTNQGLVAVDAESGLSLFAPRDAVASAGWSRLFAGQSEGERTRLVSINPATGEETAVSEAPGLLVPLVAAGSGRLVALVDSSEASYSTGRDRTTLLVADVRAQGEPRRFELAGNFEPEAFSTNDDRLFLIEHLPAQAPERYRVRQLDLATGQVQPLYRRDRGPKIPITIEEEMRGARRMQVLSPDRKTLYTLYLKQSEHLHGRDVAAGRTEPTGNVSAFVHVLSLADGWAYCLDLPTTFGRSPGWAHAMALSPDGSRLYVADTSTGVIALADMHALRVRLVRWLYESSSSRASVAAHAEAVYVGLGRKILALDPATLEAKQRWGGGSVVTGLGMSSRGNALYTLYAAHPDRVTLLDPTTGHETRSIKVNGVRSIEGIGRAA